MTKPLMAGIPKNPNRRFTGGKQKGSGRPKGSLGGNTLRAQAAKEALIRYFMQHQAKIQGALLEKALTGDVPAIKEIFDRVFGKSIQGVEMTGKDGADLFTPSPKLQELAALLMAAQKSQ
jgi:hypothetical protein